MITVVLYSRADCDLCEIARADLDSLQEKYPHKLVILDVDSDDDLKREYGFEVPVVEVGPYRLKTPFNHQELQMTLGAANDRKLQLEDLENPEYKRLVQRGNHWSRADAFTYWLSKHYLAVFNLFVFIYVGLPFIAPIVMKYGMSGSANLVYRAYSVVCHQLAFRSFFLFGEQPFYPRNASGMHGLLTYEVATGLKEDNQPANILLAERYVGNSLVGFKVALCQRDIAIYGSILFFGIFFAVSGRRLKPLLWIYWIIVGLIPIGLDGVSQLISQPPFGFLPYRESTPYLRIITGSLFGFMTAWFGYPLVEETMADSRRILGTKNMRIHQSDEQSSKESIHSE